MRMAVALMLSLAATAATAATPSDPYEAPASYRPSDVLSKERVSGPHYKVENPVAFDGYMYRFTVRSDYGPFEITGTSALRKLVVEIGAIAKLREIKASKAFASAVADSAAGPFRFAKNLIVNPADTLTAAVAASDVDGDPISFTYAWSVNGSVVQSDTTAATNDQL